MRNLEGQRFGKLTVSRRALGPGRAAWICWCECGVTTKPLLENNLLREKYVSCGCVKRERSKKQWGTHVTHGERRHDNTSSEYSTWHKMVQRCEKPSRRDEPHYRGRGITVCPQWRESFETFLKDVGRKPSSKHSIDRWPNNHGNYEPGNVRWATKEEQGRNKSTNRLLTYKGETLPAAEWSERLGQPPSLLLNRLSKLRWTVEEAIEGRRLYPARKR
jgi:hypothetical protein